MVTGLGLLSVNGAAVRDAAELAALIGAAPWQQPLRLVLSRAPMEPFLPLEAVAKMKLGAAATGDRAADDIAAAGEAPAAGAASVPALAPAAAAAAAGGSGETAAYVDSPPSLLYQDCRMFIMTVEPRPLNNSYQH